MTHRPIPAGRLAAAGADGTGLSAAQVAAARARYGFNDIAVAPPSSWKTLVRDTARDPMIWFLVAMSLLFAIIGDYTEAAVLGVALAPLVGMDAWLHRRTQASTQSLSGRLAAEAVVIRDGAATTTPARELVPGDLVEVPSGVPFPADGLIVGGADLQADESSLTGEAWPARKSALAAALPSLAAADYEHWGFAGTRLLTGPAHMRVVFTGAETLYGEIMRSAVIAGHAQTPLQKEIARLVGLTVAAAVALCLALAAIRLVQGHGLFDAFLSAATLAIAALPEEFPVVFTFFLGMGVYRLARRQALVRRAVAVENIGRVTCICSDKTGTLTEGVLTLAHRIPAAGVSDSDLTEWAALASRPDSGDPMDAALIAAAGATRALSPVATFAFTEVRRRETVIVATEEGGRLAVAKGAPETILGLCAADEAVVADWRARAEAWAAEAHKVIAVATLKLDADMDVTTEPGQGFRFAGLLALEDSLRDGVREAVESCRTAGVRVIMITGDHPATAEAIARESGMGAGRPVVVLADALDGDDPVTSQAVQGIDVVARAAPAQKLHLVQALQKSGEIVAVTGDGVNDVPALQTADVGIAMGERGTQSAREVASIVLLDDNFRTIVRAIGEGRRLFSRLQLSFAYILMVHIPLVITAAAIPLAGYPLLYLPVHIVWLELIIHPTALLAFQNLPQADRLLPTGDAGSARFFSPGGMMAIVGSGLIVTAMIYWGFERALGHAGLVAHARAVALSALVVTSAVSTAVLSGLRGRPAVVAVLGSVGSLILLVQVPFLARPLELSPLHGDDWLLVAAAGAVAGLLAGFVKRTLRDGRPARVGGSDSR